MPKLFITGATGYISGDALYKIATTYPDLEITALVRNSDKGAKVAAQYPRVRLVYGDIGNLELLSAEAAKADVILHTANAGNVAAVEALVAGLAQKQTPAYIIHSAGTGSLGVPDVQNNTLGSASEKVYDDWDGVDEVTSTPETWGTRKAENVALTASSRNPNIFGAVVVPPFIYGPGRGPDNQRSIQLPNMVKSTLQRGKGFQVGEGKNVWHVVHVQDLSDVYLALVTAALQPGGGKATWNEKGYYFTETGPIVWGDVSKAVVKAAVDRKLITNTEIDNLTGDEANELLPPYGAYVWGTNSKAKAIRARKVLDWKPVKEGLFDTIDSVVILEARALGLAKSHQEVAAGEV
ncbi:NAD(P)-binding protein [Periconia macrospinosa]|uniref:NAD(P)-binding protein n=1 Tax=Periconia macrospinosa TaxID=97972 RepID=A0A2V1EBZ4_9PLEO|nr:NAD(P)-binding protein [Periconia macrospinosa]